jgi:predicted O-methyltransferase YrrM
MFHEIPEAMLARMRELEALDARDRTDGTPRSRRLRQIEPEGARFIAIVAAAAPSGTWIEVGTSAGYSTMWLALAARERGARIVTFEVDEHKIPHAQETFRRAEAGDVVELVHGDARDFLPNAENLGFCFLDAEKEVYLDCFELVVPRLKPGGILIADNVISHRDELQPLVERALADERLDAVVVPVAKGELLCRRVEGGNQ